ncbi:MAG TPA: ABC transporter permease [Thermomicrobiales bacterium]|nr:ABC transporter permease [Thermomicrobiales bacterium]
MAETSVERSERNPLVSAVDKPAPRFHGARNWLRWFLTNPRVLLSGGFILLLILSALGASIITESDPSRIRATMRLMPPGEGGFLGTDEFGRDLFARIIYGARLTLIVSLCSVAISSLLGVVMGMSAAFFGSPTDTILMRLADAILSFPPILLAIFVISFWGSSVVNVILVIGLLYTPRFQRIAYSSTLAVQENDYILAARAIGSRPARILRLGILPNIFAPIIVQFSLAMGTAILLESGLSFLGLGPPPDVASWGRSIQQSSRFMSQHPWGVVWPSLVISTTVLAFNILGDALRDRLDPRLRTA